MSKSETEEKNKQKMQGIEGDQGGVVGRWVWQSEKLR